MAAENKKAENIADGSRKTPRQSGRKKTAGALVVLICLLIAGGGVNFYIKHLRGKQRQIVLEEQRREEEAERERLRKLLEEKRKEFFSLIEKMKEYFRQGDFEKVRALAKEALAMAEEYGFPAEDIEQILHAIDVQNYKARLKELQSLSEDIFLYLYVRTEAFKIPDWKELRKMRSDIIHETYENEYMVSLVIAQHQATEGQKGVLPMYNYLSSKAFLERGIVLREKHRLQILEEEPAVMALQKELFFASKKLLKGTIPPNLY